MSCVEDQNQHFLKLRTLVMDFMKDEKVQIVLFGSRARQDHVSFSDVDIGILPCEKLSKTKLTLLKEKIEDSNIPYKVDVVDLSEVSEDFRKEILKDAVVWKD